MTRVKSQEINHIIELLKKGKIGVVPTDTIYGILGSALIPETVEKIYKLRKRNLDKPMIILISDLSDLNHFNIKLTNKMKIFLKKTWPNSVSVVLPCYEEKFKYLHRGKKSLACRMPKDQRLINLLKQTGPLVAPSANFEGEELSESIEDAKKYFSGSVDFYLDGGVIEQKPSTLIKLQDNGSYETLRQGVFKPV